VFSRWLSLQWPGTHFAVTTVAKETAMNRKASALTSTGISMALIAAVIYFLMYLYDSSWRPEYGRKFWHHGWIMVFGGNGIGIIMLIFWVTLIGAVILLLLGAAAHISRR
jgi:hypothetical protein